ncbi:MAG: enoyl-CoA hydratase/isomerase family protein [Nitrososphaerales archaeon]
MSEESILVKEEKGVAWITLNRPSVLNACDSPMLKKLQEALKVSGSKPEVRCIVITGAGRAFCAGVDIKTLKSGEVSLGEDLKEGFNPVIQRIRGTDKPVIAMINGVAAGAGMGIALACDLRVMSEGAKFVEAFAKIGLIPDSGATFFMPRLFGLSKTMELIFTGEGVEASEALRLGAVNKVVSPDKLEGETRAIAEKLAMGPRGIGLSKRAVNKALHLDIEGALEYEARMQQIAGETEDHLEGVRAFKEKRPPQFKGK